MSPVIEVAIGLILVYLILSLLVSAINEAIASTVNRRGTFLVKGLENLLGKELGGRVFEHGMVRQLGRKRKKYGLFGKRIVRKPSYIGSPTFATAFLDVVGPL